MVCSLAMGQWADGLHLPAERYDERGWHPWQARLLKLRRERFRTWEREGRFAAKTYDLAIEEALAALENLGLPEMPEDWEARYRAWQRAL